VCVCTRLVVSRLCENVTTGMIIYRGMVKVCRGLYPSEIIAEGFEGVGYAVDIAGAVVEEIEAHGEGGGDG
jgi:hypothetical protein